MPRRAVKDTYATENVYEVPVRRFVRAGDVVPDAWDVDKADVEDVEDVEDQGTTEPAPEVEEKPAARKKAK